MSNITKIDDNALAALANFDDDFFEDNTGNAAPSFTTYKVNLAGFMDQDDKIVSEIQGYTVHTRRQVALWLGEEAGTPALTSFDGEVWDKWDEDQLKDIGDPEAYKVAVEDSPYMQWNKDPETGKRFKGKQTEGGVLGAKETYVFYVLVEGRDIPVAINIPAGSFKKLKTYKKDLASKGGTLPKVQTKFTIQPEKAGRNSYATVGFELAGVCSSKEEWDAIKTCAKLTKETLAGFLQKHAELNGEEVPF